MPIQFPGCQTAKEYDGFPESWSSAAIEPKLDGYRLNALIQAGVVSFYCRGEKPVEWGANLKHISSALLSLGFDDCLVDGEIMSEDWNTTGIVRRKNPDAETLAKIHREIKFHVFDLCPLSSFESLKIRRLHRMVCSIPLHERRARLASKVKDSDIVKLAPQIIVKNDEEVQKAFQQFLSQGFEGAMVKDLSAPYVCDRTDAWLKVKPTRTIDLKIIKVVEGLGKYVGTMGALACIDIEGTEISVGTGFNDALRGSLWAERDALVGSIIEIKAEDGGAKSTARHPVFLRLRPDRTNLEK